MHNMQRADAEADYIPQDSKPHRLLRLDTPSRHSGEENDVAAKRHTTPFAAQRHLSIVHE